MTATLSIAAAPLVELFASCTAKITASFPAQTKTSTGTFVAPGLVLTTAHGLIDRKGSTAQAIVVTWRERAAVATVEQLLPPPYPDLALLRVPVLEHPCVYLAEDVEVYDKLYAYGYTDEAPGGDPLTLEIDGVTGGQRLLKLKSGQVTAGYSGGPLLNLRSRRVAGFIRTTRNAQHAAGGRAIPVSEVFRRFPELAKTNEEYHLANTVWRSAAGEPAAELRGDFGVRLSKLREDYHWTHEMLRDRLAEKGRHLTIDDIRALEAAPPRDYRLPPKGSRDRGPLESLAKALSVDIGYLLAGFPQSEIDASVFGRRVQRREIVLKATLGTPTTFAEFVRDLPSAENELLSLQFRDFQNEKAYAVIFRLERLYSGLEMLSLNDPPMIFWDAEDVEQWISRMHLAPADAEAFAADYYEYRKHFRSLVERKKKTYQVVLNARSFPRFLSKKTAQARRKLVEDMIAFLSHPTFNLVLYEPPADKYSGIDLIEEYEIICKTASIPRSMEGTLSVVIQQTPSDRDPIVYCITPNPQRLHILQSDRAKIDGMWAEALDQYSEDLRRTEVLSEAMQKEMSREKLYRLR